MQRNPAALAAMRVAAASLSRPGAAADIARVLAGLTGGPGRDDHPAGGSRKPASGRRQDLLGAVAGDLAARRDRPQERDLGTAPADR